ncbi:MAG: D-glycerate dehydrogenase [Planctomycetota bacterium]
MVGLPRVFLTQRLPDPTMRRLREESELLFGENDRPLSRKDLVQGAQHADGMICLLNDRIDGELLDALPNLKVVSNYAVGFNNIDVEAATSRQVAVTNTPGVLADCTADMTWALLLAAARRVVEGDSLVRSGEWEGWDPRQLLGTEVTGATLGLIGLGQIGQAVSRRARGFDMRQLYWSRHRRSEAVEEDLGVEYRELNELVAESDFVSVHVALNEQTRHLLGRTEFSSMRSTAIVVNTSRGPVIDESAMIESLQRGEIAGAGLDVFEHEPSIPTKLREMPNVVLAPHLGSATLRTRCKMGDLAVTNCLAACAGRLPPNLVNDSWRPRV